MLPFLLPPPAGYISNPIWDGKNFSFDGIQTPVLEYSEKFAGWSDDLTALPEDAAGDSHPIDLASRVNALKMLAGALSSPNANILEIGCSSGYLIKDLVDSFPDATIVGADVVKLPLFKLAEDFPGVPLIRFDLLKCPLPSKVFNAIIMLNVLEHIEDDVKALQNAFNLLVPGGALIIEVPAGPFLYDSYDAELYHFRRYSLGGLQKKLKQAGFEVPQKSHLGFLLFPAFALVKLKNKLFMRKKNTSTVSSQASKTANNSLIGSLLELELKHFFGKQLPFGIRAIAVAVRPH